MFEVYARNPALELSSFLRGTSHTQHKTANVPVYLILSWLKTNTKVKWLVVLSASLIANDYLF